MIIIDFSHLLGPELWYTSYPISLVGKRQSPINITTKDCLVNNRDLRLKPLIIQYPKQFKGLVLKNPRDDKFYGWRVDVFSKEARELLHISHSNETPNRVLAQAVI